MFHIETDMNLYRVSYSKQYEFYFIFFIQRHRCRCLLVCPLHEICVSETWQNNNNKKTASHQINCKCVHISCRTNKSQSAIKDGNTHTYIECVSAIRSLACAQALSLTFPIHWKCKTFAQMLVKVTVVICLTEKITSRLFPIHFSCRFLYAVG